MNKYHLNLIKKHIRVHDLIKSDIKSLFQNNNNKKLQEEKLIEHTYSFHRSKLCEILKN